MNKKALKTLEYDKVIQMLAEQATSALGIQKCRQLTPSVDLAEILQLQQETHDALQRIFKKNVPSFGNARDLFASLKRLEVGSYLSQLELLYVADLLENTARVKAYGRHDRDDTATDSLDVIFDALEPLTLLSAEIRRCIISEDEISSDASPELKQIRRNIKATGDKVHTHLHNLMNGSLRSYLQDAVITLRDGRYCLPVKSEYRSSVPGMIHDQSSTGATLFIEPMDIVKLNNDIRALEIKEAREIEKILASLSSQAAAYTEIIRYDLENMVALDFIFARAHLALHMNATEPIFNDKGIIHIRKGRHPLIDKKKVVPIDIHLGKDFDLLIITGPNTGGKTVSMKTTGLLSLMGQSGLHIPALDRSELSVFHEIYADIGDEQSIEQSLSTFSSHMTNVVRFLEHANEHSLVLFDELCAGTDPTEGAALAIAILSDLHYRGVPTIATTHYSELKIYALQTEGVENACCEFDVATLKPTYRLLIGVPGKSNAFAISSKLGLPDYVIDSARHQISEQDKSFEDVLTSLEQRRVTLEKQRAEMDRERAALEAAKEELARQQTKMDETKGKIIQKATEEAHAMLQETKEYADQTMKDFRKFGKNSINANEMERRRNELRERMNKTQKSLEVKPAERKTKELKPSDLKLGDTVKVLSLNLTGSVNSKPDARGYLFVRCGIIRSKVHISDLELIDEPVIISKNLNKTSSGKIKMNKSMATKTEINLLGKTVHEAVAELDKYLDDAYLAHLPSVRIIHGKGTGALRKGVHQYLRSCKHVKEFHLAEFGEGDAGVTIATFKK